MDMASIAIAGGAVGAAGLGYRAVRGRRKGGSGAAKAGFTRRWLAASVEPFSPGLGADVLSGVGGGAGKTFGISGHQAWGTARSKGLSGIRGTIGNLFGRGPGSVYAMASHGAATPSVFRQLRNRRIAGGVAGGIGAIAAMSAAGGPIDLGITGAGYAVGAGFKKALLGGRLGGVLGIASGIAGAYGARQLTGAG
jgi:hypothetical protein